MDLNYILRELIAFINNILYKTSLFFNRFTAE